MVLRNDHISKGAPRPQIFEVLSQPRIRWPVSEPIDAVGPDDLFAP